MEVRKLKKEESKIIEIKSVTEEKENFINLAADIIYDSFQIQQNEKLCTTQFPTQEEATERKIIQPMRSKGKIKNSLNGKGGIVCKDLKTKEKLEAISTESVGRK